MHIILDKKNKKKVKIMGSYGKEKRIGFIQTLSFLETENGFQIISTYKLKVKDPIHYGENYLIYEIKISTILFKDSSFCFLNELEEKKIGALPKKFKSAGICHIKLPKNLAISSNFGKFEINLKGKFDHGGIQDMRAWKAGFYKINICPLLNLEKPEEKLKISYKIKFIKS